MITGGETSQRIPVGIGHLAIGSGPGPVFVAYGLGSCVGVCAFDADAGIGGMVHVLLPRADGKEAKEGEPGRYGDTGVDALIHGLVKAGAAKRRLVVKIAGGAAVLGAANAEKFKIGERNVEAIKERLKLHGLWPVAEDTGGTKGRTLELHTSSGKTFVRKAAAPAAEL